MGLSKKIKSFVSFFVSVLSSVSLVLWTPWVWGQSFGIGSVDLSQFNASADMSYTPEVLTEVLKNAPKEYEEYISNQIKRHATDCNNPIVPDTDPRFKNICEEARNQIIAKCDPSHGPQEEHCLRVLDSQQKQQGPRDPNRSPTNSQCGDGRQVNVEISPFTPSFAGAKEIGDNPVQFRGSKDFEACQAHANALWPDVKMGDQDTWKGAWAALLQTVQEKKLNPIRDSFRQKSLNQISQADLDSLKQVAQQAFAAAHVLRFELFKCEAYIGLTHTGNVDFKDEDHITASTKNTTQKSFDGKITCKTAGAETQDFPACSSAITAYNAASVAQTAVHTVQQVDHAGFQMEQQGKIQEKANEVTIGLEVQRDNMNKMGTMANQLAAFDGVKAATFMAALGNIPTRADIVKQCQKNNVSGYQAITVDYENFKKFIQTSIENFVAGLNACVEKTLITFNGEDNYGDDPKEAESHAERINASEFTFQVGQNQNATQGSNGDGQNLTPINIPKPAVASKKVEYEKYCRDVGNSTNSAITMNGQARNQMKQAAIAAGIDAAANIAKGALFKKYAGKLDDAMGNVKTFEEEISAPPMFEDGLFTECQVNPYAEGCGIEPDDSIVGFNAGTITVNAGGGGTAGGQVSEEDWGSDRALGGGSSGGKGGPGKIASPGKEVKTGGNGLTDIPPAAKPKNNMSGNSGGGGGGGPGSASAPAGGAAKPYDENAPNKVANNTYKSPGYGGVAGVSMGGGRGGGNNSNKKKENPFADMFGKNKGGPDSQNFRGPSSLGAKGNSIFEMISKRYTSVQGQKRLMEYELKP